MYMQSYDNDMEPIVRVDLVGVTDSIVMKIENYVDILPGNDDDNVELFDEDDGNEDIMDMEDNENTKNDASLLNGGEHDIPSPIFRELNWDVINSMTDKDLTTSTGLWNESNELFKGLRFESKVDLQYVVKRYSIYRNQHLIVIESELDMWPVKCKKWFEGCNRRLCACRRNSHGLFEITKYTVEEESSDSWSWFLYTLRSQVMQREGICLISDRHAGIQAAIRDPSIGWLDTKKWTLAYDGGHREYILIDPGPIDRYVLYNKEVHQYSLIWKKMILESSIVDAMKPISIGECTITLHDVSIILSLPIDGVAVSGSTCLDWREVCATLLGVVLEERDIFGQRLHLTWLIEHFPSLSLDANVESVRYYVRAFILQLIRVWATTSKQIRWEARYDHIARAKATFTSYGGQLGFRLSTSPELPTIDCIRASLHGFVEIETDRIRLDYPDEQYFTHFECEHPGYWGIFPFLVSVVRPLTF
ncbi:Serine/threonine-protein phosphatase 7 long form-like [Vitis vinifera]|uniref:Serine/threonine-protein phosphatase 7 long form-like n=1 Tax=Vitis vinifera TaxID=29760 RepID=A0A438ED31_VITVI|nr:Serine/threonine-protein phosphatase 7 long form-like [Vitis vinifera]